MEIQEFKVTDQHHVTLERFREMDYEAVEKYHLPIELMMENAGYNLARLAARLVAKSGTILIGAGTGNNGGGGLVAARRLSGWGFNVFVDIPDTNLRELPSKQLERALSHGVRIKYPDKPDLFIDAYLGFSQYLPLNSSYQDAVDKANSLHCMKISLDLPTGFDVRNYSCLFKPDMILTLAAMKTELLPLAGSTDIYLADIGLPELVYNQFGIRQPDEFKLNSLLSCLVPD
jgi:NAD(P)H-hydrate epimerase